LSLWCAVASLAAVAGCQKAPARSEPPPPKVSVAQPQTRELIDYDEYNGWIEPAETVEVRARVRGHIQKVHFTDGQLVKKGDLLFELDPRPFQQEIDRSVEQVGIFEAQLKFALVEEKRLKQMAKQDVASAIEVESAEAKARSLEAQVEAQKKEVERDRLELEYARIDAPISGRISRAMMTEGNLVNAGGSDPLLTTIVSVDPAYIYFSVDERALQRWQKQRAERGQTRPTHVKDVKVGIKFGLETDGGYPREGILDFADNQVDRTTGTILVRAASPNPTGQLVAGSRVRVRIPVSEQHAVTLIPDTSILTDQDKKYVLVIDDKNVVQRRDINPGRLLDDGMRVIVPGAAPAQSLGPNDWLIVAGLQMARLNYPVEPIRPTTQPAAVSLAGHPAR
jgi:multidrug efflux system membrane fusion protein